MPPILELTAIVKDYHGLRPLRMERLSVVPGDAVAILGLDAPAAEMFVNLVTGATLPDRGDVLLLGRPTHALQDGAEWLAAVDRLGIVTERAVLLDSLTVVQNLAVPFSLDIEPPSHELARQAESLAEEAGLGPETWQEAVGRLSSADRLRVRLGRALALDPVLVILEHPTASVDPRSVGPLAREIRRLAGRRRIATVTVTADATFAAAIADRVLTLEPATGRLRERRRWFGRQASS